MSSQPVSGYSYTTLLILSAAEHVYECRLNRPDKKNALNEAVWDEMRDFFTRVAVDSRCRVIMLTAAGSMFCSGLDIMAPATRHLAEQSDTDLAHKALIVRQTGKLWQDSFTVIEKCGKTVIGCSHGLSVGAGVEMVSAADIRFCTADAKFRLGQVDIGIPPDVGGCQRFPKLVGNQSLVRELILSCRNFSAQEALSFGFLSRVCETKEAMYEEALVLAKTIAGKSPVATLGAKTFLNYSRDHSVDESLEYAITWNQCMLQTRDMPTAAMALMSKQPAVFPDLPVALETNWDAAIVHRPASKL